MGIFSRFADIINANLNSLLDKAEDPAKMIRLIIQEMEDTLVEVRTSSARNIAEKKDLQRKIDKVKSEVSNWQEKAELAISKDREDLAKAALMEKKRMVELADDMEKQLTASNETLDQLNLETGQLQDKLQDAKARQSALVIRHKTASSRLKVREQLFSSGADDAMQRFENYERKLDNLEANVDAQGLGRKRTLAEEIDELADDEVLDAELEALKKKMNPEKAFSKTESK
ncbi:MAG: phage shock protein PspA [Gammaproteobacteria bacterium]|nr:phage shock protein PspA [Gammaproteobacteria bacterium]